MSVIYVVKWTIRPEKAEEYPSWVQNALSKVLSVPGVKEFRAYRVAAGGDNQASSTYEFENMESWASWYSNEVTQKALGELHNYASHITMELWSPSPLIPEPIRPG